jgi:hypothetical protein
MQIFSAADIGGLTASTSAQRTIAFGDLATALLALGTLWTLRRPLPMAHLMAWLVAIVKTADLLSATAVEFILAFYVPFLWVTAIVLFWQLVARRKEPLAGPAPH